MRSSIFASLCCSFLSVTAFTQPDYKSITVCHDNEKKLRNVIVGDFSVHLQDGGLVSFSTTDSSIRYKQKERILWIKNKIDTSLVKLQLTPSGIICGTSDTSFIIREPFAIKNTIQFNIRFEPTEKNAAVHTTNSDIYGECVVNNVKIGAFYNSERLKSIMVSVYNRTLIIENIKFSEPYEYHVSINDGSKPLFLLRYDQTAPIEVKMYDARNDAGVRLAGNKRGFFDGLYGYHAPDNKIPVYNFYYKLEYDQSARLKTKHTEFNLDCTY